MPEFTLAQTIVIAALPVLFAITVHEVAHGWVAKQLGDPTADQLGRLTLNPIKHIDPIGTILVPLVMIVTLGVAIGWAKPVPVNWQNLHHPKRDMAIVAAAGPAANLMMALFWAIIIKIMFSFPGAASGFAQPLIYMAQIGVLINVLLMVFNLLPIPPLDGGRVAVGLLPNPWSVYLSRIEPYGFFILVGLMLSGVLWFIIRPLQNFVYQILQFLIGL